MTQPARLQVDEWILVAKPFSCRSICSPGDKGGLDVVVRQGIRQVYEGALGTTAIHIRKEEKDAERRHAFWNNHQLTLSSPDVRFQKKPLATGFNSGNKSNHNPPKSRLNSNSVSPR